MGSVREAEEAIRLYNGFNIERFTLRVKVALSEEEKKQKQQQKQVSFHPVNFGQFHYIRKEKNNGQGPIVQN